MKFLVSLNGKQYEVIVANHTANVTNVIPLTSKHSNTKSYTAAATNKTEQFPFCNAFFKRRLCPKHSQNETFVKVKK